MQAAQLSIDTAEMAAENAWRFNLATYAEEIGGGAWRPYRWCVDLADRLTDAVLSGDGRIVVTAPPQHGKALDVNTPIPTPDGWKRMGDLGPGDLVFGLEGRPITVVGVSPEWRDRRLYRIAGNEVEPFYADAEHEWLVRLDRKWGARTIRTSRYLADRTSPRKPLIEHHRGMALPDAELAIHPWLLGMWLGDGTSSNGAITSGDQDCQWVRKKIENECGFKTRMRSDGKTFGVLGLHVLLRHLDLLGNKFIPSVYLRSSARQRLELLQGLVDSDGYVAKDGQVEFCTTNIRLADVTAELVRSLGVKCNVIMGRATLYGKYIGPKYRVMFYMAGAASMPRKAERCRNGVRSPGLYVDVQKTQVFGDTVCIEVDSEDHLFLAGRSMVPTHNSETTSKMLSQWFLDLFPHKRVILASYGDTLASGWSRQVRDEFVQNPKTWTEIEPTHSRANDWSTTRGGGMKTAGIEGGITGRGADLFIIDDPHKDWVSVQSAAGRQAIIDWFKSVVYPRLQPGATVIVVQTRWHKRDLAGYLLTEHDDDWTELRYTALAESNDLLGRKPGEALCPERYTAERLQHIRDKGVGSRVFAGLYQQRPSEAQGNYIKRDWIRYYGGPTGKELPTSLRNMLQSWDLNFGKKAKNTKRSSYVVGQCWAEDGADVYLLDQLRGRWTHTTNKKKVVAFREAWPACDLTIIEDAASGAPLVDDLRGTVRGLIAVAPKGDKESRLQSIAPMFESGNVWLPHPSIAPWVYEYVEEVVDFPNGEYSDQVDTTSQALKRLSKRGGVGEIDMGLDRGDKEGWDI